MPRASLHEAAALGTSQPANWACNKTTAILSQAVGAVCIAACAAQAFGATQLLVGTYSFYSYSWIASQVIKQGESTHTRHQLLQFYGAAWAPRS
jgi:hypothetical protein